MPTLVLLQGGEARRFDLTQAETVLGRHPECAVCLDSNMVSRRHARVFQESNSYFIEDLGSGNGTTVNGQRIFGKTPVNHEDRIKVGPILLRFEDASQAAAKRNATTEPLPFNLDLSSGLEDGSTIMGSISSSGQFGALEVRPEAKLKAVLEINRTLAGTIDLQKILPRILDTLFNVFPQADRGCVLLKDEHSGQMVPRAIKHRRKTDDDSVKLSRTVLKKVLDEKTAILSADAANDARFNAAESISNFTIRSMMCVPLLGLDGEPMGVINVDTQNPLKQFTKDDLELLTAVAGQAALSYENARLMVSHAEKQKQDNEMKIARDVQRALLPEHLPEIDGYTFFASYESAQAVGGDYYDCLQIDDGPVMCLAFGDVAGKGVPASLVMSRLSSIVQSTLDFVRDVGEAAARINNHMCSNAIEGRFVTFVLAFVDTSSNRVSFVNAGHMAPMIRKPDGSVIEIGEESVGLPLGVVEDYSYDTIEWTLEPGETVVIYTDGVSEAMNPEGGLYGIERIRALVSGKVTDAATIGRTILDDVKKHANGRAQNDDITLMSFGRSLPGAPIPPSLRDTVESDEIQNALNAR